MGNWIRITIGAIAVLAGALFLGGSAIWVALGLYEDLSIDGRATPAFAPPAGLGEGWPAYGGDQGGARYSAAQQITPSNANQLQEAWRYRTGSLAAHPEEPRRVSFQTTPILVEGTLVLCATFNEVMALDPATGEEKWRFDPKLDPAMRPANNFNCRGVAYWQDKEAGEDQACRARIFTATADTRLIALDAKTGLPCAAFGNQGTVQIEPDIALRYAGEWQISSAPAVVGDVVVTGTAIHDNLRTEAPAGTVFAFNARTGEPAWTFNPVPRDPEDPARASWADNSADVVGHANVWSSLSVDEERGLIFLPTSSPSPDYYGGHRAGNNHYANSIVALHGKTGKIAWHFQTVHHDVWDYDLPAQPSLLRIHHDGKAKDVVVQVTKMGLIFVLDRDSGTPVHPVTEQPVPQDGVPGEVLSPTQPIPDTPPPVVPSKLNPQAAFGITAIDKHVCRKKLSALRAEGLYTPPTVEGTLAYPFSGGGANWGGAAFDPARNLLIINMNNLAQSVHLHPQIEDKASAIGDAHSAEFAPMEGVPYGMSREPVMSPLGLPCTPPPWGVIAGVDLDSGEIVWRHPFGTTKDLAPGGLALKTGTPSFGGPIATAGGVIFISGTLDYYLRALNAETGKELWKGRLPAGGQATPMTYVWEGRQYVVIAAGGHGMTGTKRGDYVIAYALAE